uniref:C-type lectin domain-containing protein n=1 Tax=Malurus cyaneus samueli TaxID=2593467 RepID=A0A8C5U2M0_9PASS
GMVSCPSTAEQVELSPSSQGSGTGRLELGSQIRASAEWSLWGKKIRTPWVGCCLDCLLSFSCPLSWDWWQPLPGAPSQLLHFWCAGPCQFCPVGWLWDAGQCYYFSSARKSWDQSREDCYFRGAQLATVQANTTLVSAPSLACPTPCQHWADPSGHPPQHCRYARSYQVCGRVSGLGLSGGACMEALRWICKKSAATVQWIQSSPPAFLWGNTTYSCVRP